MGFLAVRRKIMVSFSNRHDFIFVHVPRTAGTSIGSALRAATADITHQSRHRQLSYERNASGLHGTKSFGFVRNPFDRLLSMFIMTHPNQEPCDTSRDTFLHYLMGLSEHAKPAAWFLDGVDRVGRFENLDADFSDICQWLELPAVPPLRRENGWRHAHYAEYYDARSLDWVRRTQAVDFTRYGYSPSVAASGITNDQAQVPGTVQV